MALGCVPARQDRDLWQRGEPVLTGRAAQPLDAPVARGGEAGEVRGAAARHEHAGELLGELEDWRSQSIATSSRVAASGEAANAPAFWSRAEVSQSAARPAGVAPPITK